MFRVMTLNLNYEVARHGPWPERRALVVLEIRRWQPDLVALQAVRQAPGGDNQVEQLSRELPGYVHAWFEPMMIEADGGARGMAFLGRVPFERRGTHPLTYRAGTEDGDRRALLRVHCAASATGASLGPGGMEFYNAHFSWVEAQARDNIRDALPFLGGTRVPALLLGDFNQPPGRPLHETLRKAGWVDAWSWLRGEEAGYTYEADRPQSRIDFAYANAHLSGRLVQIHVVGEAYRQPPRLSDHLGIIVTLSPG